MKNSPPNAQIEKIVNLLVKYNLVIFVIVVAAGLIASVYILTGIVNRPYVESSAATQNTANFDSSTINMLSGLETSSKNVNYKTLPSGRISPFSE